MEITQKLLVLVKPARKSGGDKYETKEGDWAVYVPQSLSRVNGNPRQTILLKLETMEGE